MMAKKEKKPVHHVVMTEGKRQIIQQLLQEYDIQSVRGKMILPSFGKEFFPPTVSKIFCPR